MRLGSIKVVKGTQEIIIPCSRIKVDRSVPGQVTIIVKPTEEKITIPDDGDTIYLQNNINGGTIDTIRVTPKRKEFRHG